ncbi:uncharacterized protein LOC142531353 isoform X3 [Primulina tabacum]|uniref:uncharacterized protein LOC142531353 isoform X3 n=1 Tax=Primulina tabacum TaxID=48773 RepID=UPI003F5A94DC
MSCMHVSIDNAVDKLTHLPFPIPNECHTVGDAIGTHVAWPAHLVVMQDEKLQRKKNVDHRNNIGLSSSVPRSLHLSYCYCKHALTDEQNLSLLFDHDLFDEDYELLLHLEDIIPFCSLDPIFANCIVVYMWHLYKKMKKDNKTDKFRFVNPHTIPYMLYVTKLDENGKIEHLNERASVLAERLSGASTNQLVLVPHNVGYHWILTIIDPYKEMVYLLDSLCHRNRYDVWKYVVDMSVRLFNSNKERKEKKQAIWEVVKSTLRKKLMKCDPSGQNAYKIIFTNRDEMAWEGFDAEMLMRFEEIEADDDKRLQCIHIFRLENFDIVGLCCHIATLMTNMYQGQLQY